jgi:MYXO-CTERM domain-containing protein
MQPRALIRISLTAGLLAAVGAAGCSLAQDEETSSSPDQIVGSGDVSALLKSTLVLAGGCTAAKVGPKHLLVSAGCVSGKEAFAVGKVLAFTSAATGKAIVAPPAPAPAPEPAPEGDEPEADAAPPTDAGAKDAGRASSTSRDVTIAEVKIHPSYEAKCKENVCGMNTLIASDAPDIAVIILENDLDTVPSIPVDLDAVGQSDPLLVVTSGCTTLDGKAAEGPKTVKSIAVPAKSVNHAGSAYEKSPQLVTRLASSYVVTAGAGWRNSDTRLCKGDIGSPIFRAGSASVAGITANYTTYAEGKLPVTIHHTRVDAASRFKIGTWLSELGVETMHSCSETAGGCVKRDYDGGAPKGPATDVPGEGSTQPGDAGHGDGGLIAPDASDDGGDTTSEPPEAPSGPHSDQLPSEDPGAGSSAGEGEEDYSDAAAPKKKKKASSGGCSAAPGGPAPAGEMFLALGLVMGAAIIRRRRK